MRLWHYKLLPVLPDLWIQAQWRECLAIKKGWEEGTLKHRLVTYVIDYDKKYFLKYLVLVKKELDKRNINYKKNLFTEIFDFCFSNKFFDYSTHPNYPEHNNRYLTQCYYNLQEKYDRGFFTEEEWQKIENLYKKEIENE